MPRPFSWVTQAFLLLGALVAGPVHAFQVDAFWSGMTSQQLRLMAAASGLLVQPGADGKLLVATHVPPAVIGEAVFCGNYLAAYTRKIQSDADYAQTLSKIFSNYGPPRKMSFGGDVATGSTAGAMRASGETLWVHGPDRIRMESYFDWRMAQGDLQRQQPATVRFETLNPCMPYPQSRP